MTPESIMTMGNEAIKVGLLVAAPLLLVALITGLLVSIFQASTQINEMTLSFIPKILAIIATGTLLGPWMMGIFLDYTRSLFTSLPYVIG